MITVSFSFWKNALLPPPRKSCLHQCSVHLFVGHQHYTNSFHETLFMKPCWIYWYCYGKKLVMFWGLIPKHKKFFLIGSTPDSIHAHTTVLAMVPKLQILTKAVFPLCHVNRVANSFLWLSVWHRTFCCQMAQKILKNHPKCDTEYSFIP